MAGFITFRCLVSFGLNPLPFHAVLLALLAGNLYLVYRFARRLGTTELQAGLAALVVAYHAGLSNLYYDTAFIYDVLCFSFYMGGIPLLRAMSARRAACRAPGKLRWCSDCISAPSTPRRWRSRCRSYCWPTR